MHKNGGLPVVFLANEKTGGRPHPGIAVRNLKGHFGHFEHVLAFLSNFEGCCFMAYEKNLNRLLIVEHRVILIMLKNN